ncbi:bifunctional folylpolyglutamate synthase/dihydrofolate synthase [Helicobacter pylori]|uniref:folylpolyglutamate synthase/dihydrofolate synthase family protein n=1 Tax=Helicobacter pylori TaxID=210 RepID=UPI0009A44615|nr:folylpolyglutamate synthase/dihydrofolate synthase family protein [Helicobacter pylori]NHA57491.1 bifunctional folylpolyglutamate synthase/dihydrofolate synthase [Helicobacter pylori]NHA65061.1 bifunctional folylpolyglutamate synthase/dihydrofolate synthase [Helicobacter pylori]OPG32862.1 bifunctional folylpolyglutamate synthase/dihydrofolate synthase [Helicobacter pylori]OPG60692.1 bifunctional folylpolyglutamate synthase/dihydrofolate synthase [Helicobacter pylori]OPG67750.1 bifunctional 
MKNSSLNGLKAFLETKPKEYHKFDPSRFIQIYKDFKNAFFEIQAKVIHVVGTNGKGSTGRFLTLLLADQNFKVLHFTSPHVFEFRERFFLNGSVVEESVLENAHQQLQSHAFSSACSYFEYATLLAVMLAKDCDYLVLEAGLGGEFDSTNALEKTLSVFTPIDYDHKEFLGDSLESIAQTKLKAMGPLNIIAPQQELVLNVAQKIAKEKHAKLIVVQNEISKGVMDYIERHHLAYFLAMNLEVALKAFETLLPCNKQEVLKNLKPLNLIGRCELLSPNILIDVGHNPHSAKALKEEIKRVFNTPIVLIYNCYQDKDAFLVLEILKPVIKKVLILELHNERIIQLEKLKGILETLGLEHALFEELKENENYLVYGSFLVANAFYERYPKKRD